MATQSESQFLGEFEAEVVPTLESVVGQTLQLAFNEVLEEQEQDAREVAANDFDIVRNMELAELQRLEALRLRKDQEEQRRAEQQQLQERQQAEAAVQARAEQVARQELSGLRGDVFSRLAAQEVFADPLPAEIESSFLPELKQKMVEEAERIQLAHKVATESVAAGLDQSLLWERAQRARKQLADGWQAKDFCKFELGFKALGALGLKQEVDAARQRFAELHKAHKAAQYASQMRKSAASVKKWFGRAEREDAELLDIASVEAAMIEAEALGENDHTWNCRARLAKIRTRSLEQQLAQQLTAAKAGEAGYEAGLSAHAAASCLYEDGEFGEEGWTRPEPAETEPHYRLAARLDDQQEEPEPQEEPEAEAEEAPAEEEAEPAPAVDQTELLVLEAGHLMVGSEGGGFETAAGLLAAQAPALLAGCFDKFDSASGSCLLKLFKDGVQTSVDLDLRLPAAANPHRLWPGMLRKGCAKLLGGYPAVEQASLADLLHVMTGSAAAMISGSELREMDEPEEGCAKLWTELQRLEQAGWAVGLAPEKGEPLKLEKLATAPSALFGDKAAEPEEPAEPAEEPEPAPEARLVKLSGDLATGGSLADLSSWPEGLASQLELSEPGCGWIPLEELVEHMGWLLAVKSPEPEEEGGKVARQHVKGQWRTGAALGANPHFELSCPDEPATVQLTVVAEEPTSFSVTVMPDDTTAQHFVALPTAARSRMAMAAGRTACLELQLSASPTARTVVVSRTEPGGGGFTVTAASLSPTVKLTARELPASVVHRYDYRWHGAAAGGPRAAGFDRWRNNPLWRVSAKPRLPPLQPLPPLAAPPPQLPAPQPPPAPLVSSWAES